MKAVLCTQYGPPEVLKLKEVEKPAPGDHEVLIKIFATTVTAGDSRMRSFTVPRSFWLPARLTLGLRRPRKAIPGMELAGEVEAVGSAVRRLKKGDQVYAFNLDRYGTYAEYTCLPESSALAYKPATATYEESVSLPFGALTALHFLRKGQIQSGHRVLIYGASGNVGTYAVQLARHFGAEVIGVCSSANVALVQALGAQRVIDYTREDVTKSDGAYDIIFDTVGKSSFADCLRLLKPGGTYLQAVASPILSVLLQQRARRNKQTFVGGTVVPTTQDLLYLKELVETGKLKPVIDRCYPLEQIVEAHRYVDQGHKKGSVVITVEGTPRPGATL